MPLRFNRNMDAKTLLIALLAATLMCGCTATPNRGRDRTGDFIVNLASAPPAAAVNKRAGA